ncbi:carbonic anhydrase [Bacillus hominis]|uniref:Carbonic anhydrase n=1 Tax=Bacillus hominis TaxID=2817478 RepID=A0ABT7RDR0_9BACI|nr:carbonic anhydrase [Bacillus hominis]MDM5195968.1 carbonic anhydrase [Bacillus hominis]MDM5435628.1 carbonic anhydrase [Bacillus hominis]MDM5441076.1 carbonic anhydrase [Bacillus hominis]
MPKIKNISSTIQELEQKKEYLLSLSPVIPTWNTNYQPLFKEIHQGLLKKVNEKIEKHYVIINICSNKKVSV